MSNEPAYLALLLDGPMQSWGFESQFEHRATGPLPTKSGIAGLLCAALGAPKRSGAETEALEAVRASEMLAVAIPRVHPVRRLTDYHTVLDTRRAEGGNNEDAVQSRREYLLDARFGIVLKLSAEWAYRFASALESPVWGIWLGRKCCVPAAPVCGGVWETEEDAVRRLTGGKPLASLTRVRDVGAFEDADDTLRDQPFSFGSPESSGSHLRQYGIRRIRREVPETGGSDERPAPAPENSR